MSEALTPAPIPATVKDPSLNGLVTTRDAAAVTGLNVRTIEKMAQSGRIEASKPSWARGQWLIPIGEVQRVADEMEALRHGD